MRRIFFMVAASLMVLAISAANAQALEVRFVHAVAGAGAATLTADGKAVGGEVSFGELTGYAGTPRGVVKLRLRDAGGRTLAERTRLFRDGRYTVVAMRRDRDVVLRAYRDGEATGGQARVRAIAAAPELGETRVDLDGTTVTRRLGAGEASDYANVEPGTYEVAVKRPSGQGGALASQSGVNLVAGTASTAIVVGSGGAATRVVVASDATAAPRQAPATGLGGLRGETPWLAPLLAALAAGALGGVAYALVSRRRHGT
jgi:hypothetical protein